MRSFHTPLSLRFGAAWLTCISLCGLASAQTVLVNETFNRADSGTLGTATSGQPWTAYANPAGIQSNQAVFGSGFVLTALDTGSSTGTAQIRVTAVANEFWMILRLSDSANYWRFGRWQGGAYQLQQVQNNALGSPSIQTGAAILPQAGDVITCTLQASGLECGVNGTMVASTSNTFNSTATRLGLSGYQSSGAAFDDLAFATLAAAPDLSLTLSGPADGYSGTSISWTATVTNVGTSSASAAQLLLTQPAGQPALTFSGATCTLQGNQYQCALGNLAAQAAANVQIQMSNVAEASSVVIAGSVPAVTGETQTSQNSASHTTTLRPGIPALAVVVDQFNRADGALTTADSGQAWTHLYSPITLQGGTAAPGSGFVLSRIQAPVIPDMARVIVTQLASEFWLVVRFENGSNYWRFGRSGGQNYQLQRIVNNAIDNTGITTHTSVAPAAGDVLTCNLLDTSISCSARGVQVASASSSAGASSLGVGLSTYQGSNARFDDFVAAAPPPKPDFSVSLVPPGLVYTTSPISWTVDVRNESVLQVAASVVITPPSTVTQVQIPGYSCSASSGSWTCPLGMMSGGQVISLTVSGVTGPNAGNVVFAASATPMPQEVVLANNNASATTMVHSLSIGPPMLQDTFNRPDSPSLGTATSGQAWSAHSSNFSIIGGRAAPSSGYALVTADAAESELDISATLVTPASEFWLVLRFESAQNYWRFGRRFDQAYDLQRIANGSIVTGNTTTLASVQPAPGDVLNCTTNADGVICNVNGVPVMQSTDPAGKDATRVGFSGYQSGVARFDELMAFGPPPTPNPTLSMTGEHHVLIGEQHSLTATVTNKGRLASGTGTLDLSIPASITVNSVPGGCIAGGSAGSYNCSVSGLAPNAAQNFTFTLTSQEATPFTVSGTLTVSGDAVPTDNSTTRKTFTHQSGYSIVDRFDRSNTGSGLGQALSGQTWTALTPGFKIQNGTARADAAGAFSRITTPYAFGTIEAVLGANAATTSIVFRVVDANNYYRLSTDANGYYQVFKVINGSVQPLALGNTQQSIIPAAGDRVRIITRPDDGVFVAVNDVHVIDKGDQDLMYATGWGIASVGGPATVDEFSVNPKIEGYNTIDNFNVPDGSALFKPTSGVKYKWTQGEGSLWQVVGQAAKPVDEDYSYVWIDTTSERATVEAKVTNPGTGAWLIFRFDEITDTYFRFGSSGGTYGVQFMYKYWPEPMPVTVETLANVPVQAGAVLRVVQLDNGTVECYVNDVLTHRFVDSQTNARWTLNGLAAQGTSTSLDDFKVSPYSR